MAVLAASAALRLWLLPLPALKDDMEILISWGNTLRAVPLDEFYAHADPDCDYPPVYLYILWASFHLQSLVSGSTAHPMQLESWVKLAPVGADMVLGIVAFLLCRRFLGPVRALLATVFVVFNPGLLFVSAVWGQVDSIPNAFAMASLLALISGKPSVAAALAGAGVLVKPQYLLFLAGPGLAYLRAETRCLPPLHAPKGWTIWAHWMGRRVIVPVVVLMATMELAMLPFSESLWPMGSVEWTLWDRTVLRAGKFPLTSLGAFNLWATPIADMWQPDSKVAWFSLSYQTWGLLLMAVAILPALILAWRKPKDPLAILWSSYVVYLPFFVLSTRVHERFLFTAIPLVAAAAAFRLWVAPHFVAVSALYFANLWAVYHTQPSGPGRLEASQYGGLVDVASMLSVVLLAAALAAIPMLMRAKENGSSAAMWQDRDAPLDLVWQASGPLTALVSALRSPSRNPARISGLLLVLLGATLGAGYLAGRTVGAEDQGVHTVAVRSYKLWQDSGV
ncbi:MAG: hypothetical protein ACYC5J_16120, partial [Chloroflexota bacterium]